MANDVNKAADVPEDLWRRAMELDPAVRVEFADRLYQSVEPEDTTDEWDPEYLAELEERVARYERGETQARDAFEALDELRRKYSPPPQERPS
jgi:hypothetical protein